MLWCCDNFVPLGQLIAISMPRQAHEHSRVGSVVNILKEHYLSDTSK